MKKYLLLLLICFVQNIFSQSNKQTSQTKSSEIPTLKINSSGKNESLLTIEEPTSSSSATSNEDNLVYNTAGIDVRPEFPGGIEKFHQFVDHNFNYPKTKNIELKGKKIYAVFVIEKDGSLTDIKILRDAGYETGSEALRVLKMCPNWIPGEQHGKKVRVLYSVPITMK